MRKRLEEQNAKLDDVVDQFLSAYRNTCHQTTEETPAKLLLGHHLRCSLDFLFPPSPTSTLETSLKRKVQKSQAKQKECYDYRSRPRNLLKLEITFYFNKQKGQEKLNGGQLQLLEFLPNSIICENK